MVISACAGYFSAALLVLWLCVCVLDWLLDKFFRYFAAWNCLIEYVLNRRRIKQWLKEHEDDRTHCPPREKPKELR